MELKYAISHKAYSFCDFLYVDDCDLFRIGDDLETASLCQATENVDYLGTFDGNEWRLLTNVGGI